MTKKKKMLLVLGLFALLSCSNVEKNKSVDINVSNLIQKMPKIEKDVEYNGVKGYIEGIESGDIQVGNLNLYKGEVYNLNKKINDKIELQSITSKNPILFIFSGEPKYDEYVDTPGKLKVEEQVDPSTSLTFKKVTFLDQYTAYMTVKDLVSNDTREIMLYSPQTVQNFDYSIAENTRYKDIQINNDRVFRDIVTNNGGYESEKYTNQTKYRDYDDLAGKKEVEIHTTINGVGTHSQKQIIDFGTKLTDYSNDYSKLLNDFSKTTLKFDENGNVLNGFDNYAVEKILDYENAITDNNPKIEFKTYVKNPTADNKAGEYDVVREIIKDGKVVFSKKQKAFVGFSGTTVMVADEAFNLSDLVEKRSVRYTPDGIDKLIIDSTGIGLERPHGSTVVGSMIDEIAIGESNYATNLISFGMSLKTTLAGIIDDKTAVDDDEINKEFLNIAKKLSVSKFTYYDVYVKQLSKFIDAVKKYDDLKTKLANITDPVEKEELRMKYYEDVRYATESLIAITEDNKLKETDLHFKLMSIDLGYGLRTSTLNKYLPTLLSQDKNTKVMNMSYGNEYTAEEYLRIISMTNEEIQRAADAYNNSPEYQLAIQSWIEDLDNKGIKSQEAGDLYIPKMAKYFIAKEKIDANDFKKLLELRMLTLEHVLFNSTELQYSNQDILFVVSQGNSYNNRGQARPDLTEFDENGNKVIYVDPDKKYNNGFTSIPTMSNVIKKAKALKDGTEYKYDYSYRKNMIGAVGISPKVLNSGANATDNISDSYGLNTSDGTSSLHLKDYSTGLLDRYTKLKEEIAAYENDNSLYTKEYIERIKEQVNELESSSKRDLDPNGRKPLFSFTRAGLAKLWVIAAEGMYSYNKEMTDEEKAKGLPSYFPDYLKAKHIATYPFQPGSSFAAPRVSAVAAEVGTKFPWMSAHQIKQTVLTTATDDYRVISEDDPNTGVTVNKRVGSYGVDDVIGWGILDKNKAYKGPSRFVRALTLEDNSDSFIADIPYGTYKFSNDIEGGFDPLKYLRSDKQISELEYQVLYALKDYTDEEILSPDFGKQDNEKHLLEQLEKANLKLEMFVNDLRPAVRGYVASLDEENKGLFESAGLLKKGKGTLILSGDNTYTDLTEVEDGTLIVQGSLLSPVVVYKNAKLKLDMALSEAEAYLDGEDDYVAKIKAPVYNFGKVYSYSKSDKILDEYIPQQNSLTYIAANAKLQVASLNLDNTNKFNFQVFRKTGMDVFKKPELRDETEALNAAEEKEDAKINYDETEVLVVNNVSKSDLYKINIGETQYTPYIKLIVSTEDIAGDNDHVKLVAKLKRDISSTPNKILAVRNDLVSILKDLSDDKKLEVINNINDLDWLTRDNENLLTGEILNKSMLASYSVNELRNSNLLKEASVYNPNKFSIFANSINEFTKDNNLIRSNGVLAGAKYDTKYFGAAAAFDYVNGQIEDKDSILFDAFGAAATLQGRYKNFSLTAMPTIDVVSKTLNSNKDLVYSDREGSVDTLLGLVLEAKYNYTPIKYVTLSPYVRSNVNVLSKSDYSGSLSSITYKSGQEKFTKANMTFGLDLAVRPVKDLDITIAADYTKYLTDTLIKNKMYLTDYRFSTEGRGVELKDHNYTVGVGFRYKSNIGLEISGEYVNKNVKSHQLNLGLKLEF